MTKLYTFQKILNAAQVNVHLHGKKIVFNTCIKLISEGYLYIQSIKIG